MCEGKDGNEREGENNPGTSVEVKNLGRMCVCGSLKKV